MASIDDMTLYPGSDSESGEESEWIFGTEFLDTIKATLKLPLDSRRQVRTVSQISHDNPLQDVLADAVGILKREGGHVWTSSDGIGPFDATWDELPDLAMLIDETHTGRSIPGPYDKEPYQWRRNWCALLTRLEIRDLSADVLAVWEFAEVLEGGMKREGQRTEHLKGPAMYIGLCIVRDRIMIAGQRLFDHLRDVAAEKDITEMLVRGYEPGVMCDSQEISGWGLSRWRFWKRMLRRIRDELLGELGLVEEEVLPLINEPVDRMEAIERDAGPIEGDNWPKLLQSHNNEVNKEGEQKTDGEGKQENEKNMGA